MSTYRPAYPGDLKDSEWKILEPLLPIAKPCGRHRGYAMRGVIKLPNTYCVTDVPGARSLMTCRIGGQLMSIFGSGKMTAPGSTSMIISRKSYAK
jgi:hypothetical protein